MDYIQETQPGLEGRKGFPKKVEPELRWEAEKECAKALEGGNMDQCVHCTNVCIVDQHWGQSRERNGEEGSEARDLDGSLHIQL